MATGLAAVALLLIVGSLLCREGGVAEGVLLFLGHAGVSAAILCIVEWTWVVGVGWGVGAACLAQAVQEERCTHVVSPWLFAGWACWFVTLGVGYVM